MPKTIAVIGALDTKGEEFLFVKKEIEKRGHSAAAGGLRPNLDGLQLT